TEPARKGQQPLDGRVSEVAQDEERRVRSRVPRRPEVLLGREEPLREQRQPRRAARRTETVPRSPEPLIDEKPNPAAPGPLVRGGDDCRGSIGTEVASERRAALDFRDRGQSGSPERVLKPHC